MTFIYVYLSIDSNTFDYKLFLYSYITLFLISGADAKCKYVNIVCENVLAIFYISIYFREFLDMRVV